MSSIISSLFELLLLPFRLLFSLLSLIFSLIFGAFGIVGSIISFFCHSQHSFDALFAHLCALAVASTEEIATRGTIWHDKASIVIERSLHRESTYTERVISMKKKTILVIALLCLISLVFAACTEAPSAPPAPSPELEPVEAASLEETEEAEYADSEECLLPDAALQEFDRAEELMNHIQVRFAADETTQYFAEANELVDLDMLAAYRTFTDPDTALLYEQAGQRIVFTTDIPVSDFQFLALGYDDDFSPFVEGVLYSLDELTPEEALVVVWIHTGCFTSGRGISFVEDDVTRYFEIMLSNMDGRLFLTEIEPQ